MTDSVVDYLETMRAVILNLSVVGPSLPDLEVEKAPHADPLPFLFVGVICVALVSVSLSTIVRER